MITAVALATALVMPSSTCLRVEVGTQGRSAHGSTVMPSSAPHLLIVALDEMTAWAEAEAAVLETRISHLEAARAVNIIPPRATATVDIRFDPSRAQGPALVAELAEALGPKVAIESSSTPCAARREDREPARLP